MQQVYNLIGFRRRSQIKAPSRVFLFLIALVLCNTLLEITAKRASAGFVPSADRLSISQPRYSGQWKGPDLKVDYRYSRDQGQIDLSGNVIFAHSMAMGYTLLHDFRLGAIFLDENGKALQSNGLVTERGSFDSIPFHAKLKLLSSSVSMAFSYQGEAGGGDSGPTSFWFYPIR